MPLTFLPELTGIGAYQDGIAVAEAKDIDFKGGSWTVVYNAGLKRLELTFSGASSTDPASGFEVRLLPQLDTAIASANATPITVSTVAIDTNHVYEFGVYCQGYGTAATTRIVQKFAALYERLTGAPTLIETSPLVSNRSTDIAGVPGLALIVSGNNVVVQWTGHATLALRARLQVGYVKRPVVLAT